MEEKGGTLPSLLLHPLEVGPLNPVRGRKSLLIREGRWREGGRGRMGGERKGWKGREREMEVPTYKRRGWGEGKQGDGESPGFSPGSKGARIVTAWSILQSLNSQLYRTYLFIYLFISLIHQHNNIKQLQHRVYNTLTENLGQLALIAFQINLSM